MPGLEEKEGFLQPKEPDTCSHGITPKSACAICTQENKEND